MLNKHNNQGVEKVKIKSAFVNRTNDLCCLRQVDIWPGKSKRKSYFANFTCYLLIVLFVFSLNCNLAKSIYVSNFS